MKLNKIITMALAAFSVLAVSCTDEVTATGDATVGFAASEFESGLGSQYINVPVVTSGESTVYPIKVNIEVAEYTGDFAAKEDVDYMITSKEIYVASPESKPVIEIKILNPTDADALYFSLKIASQENAQKISQETVLVKCVKSDLDRVCGQYTATGYNYGERATQTWTVSSDGGMVVLSGIDGGNLNGAGIKGELKDGVITFALGPGTSNYLGAFNFTNIGPHFVFPVDGVGTMTADGFDVSWLTEDHEVKAVPSEDFKSLTFSFEENHGFLLALFAYPTPTPTDYLYDGPFVLDNQTIVKK